MLRFSAFFLTLFAFLWLGQPAAYAQFDFPPLSGKAHITQVVGNTLVSVDYERPSARNRLIFGGLVPWDQVWRMGAGPCTKFTFSKAVSVGKQRIEAGCYSLFGIPGKENWMIIFNSDTSLYGAYDYDPAKDVARFTVPVEPSSRYYETFTIDIDLVPNHAEVYIAWEHVSLHFPLHTSADEEVMRYISEKLLTDQVKEPQEYAMAGDYLLFNQLNLQDIIVLADKALALDPGSWAARLKMETYVLMRHPKLALEVAEKTLAYRKSLSYESEELRNDYVEHWEQSVAEMKKLIAK